MNKITLLPEKAIAAVKFMYPDLMVPQDFSPLKFSDDDNLYLEWKTDKYSCPTDEELNSILVNNPDIKTERELNEIKAAARESAISKLSALGLSEDEIKALVGA